MHAYDGLHAALHGAQGYITHPGSILAVGLGIGHGQCVVVELGSILIVLAVMHIGEGDVLVCALGHQRCGEDQARLGFPGNTGQGGGKVYHILAAGTGQGMDAFVAVAVGLKEDLRPLFVAEGTVHHGRQMGNVGPFGGITGLVVL